jgi:hypothetical protein
MRLKGGAVQTIYIGVDFHARQQTICYLTTDSGELLFHQLKHEDKTLVRAFYAQFNGHVIVGLEASGYSPWFERLLEELGCEIWLGHATEIRRRARWRHKNDRRDAELILDLMVHDVTSHAMAMRAVAATTRAAQRTLAGDHALAAATKPG